MRDEINFAIRIVTVFDALTADGSCCGTLRVEWVFAILLADIGKAFDGVCIVTLGALAPHLPKQPERTM